MGRSGIRLKEPGVGLLVESARLPVVTRAASLALDTNIVGAKSRQAGYALCRPVESTGERLGETLLAVQPVVTKEIWSRAQEAGRICRRQVECTGGGVEATRPGQAPSGAAEATTANSCNLGQQQHQCQCHKNWCSETKKRFKVLQSYNFQKEAGPQLVPLVRLFQCDKAQPDG